MSSPGIELSIGPFDRDADAIRAVRVAVFVDEQRIPLDEEFDDADRRCVHAVARVDGRPVATGRIAPDGRIGRVAVLAAHRRAGLGAAVMEALEEVGRSLGIESAMLGAQESAVPFYERLGYEATAERFVEAGIPHVIMRKGLA